MISKQTRMMENSRLIAARNDIPMDIEVFCWKQICVEKPVYDARNAVVNKIYEFRRKPDQL